MSDTETRFFVRAFIRFLNKQVEEKGFSSDIAESIDVAVQCLDTVYDTSSLDAENPLSHIDIYELYHKTFLEISPKSKEEAESYKNEGNRLMKEEKFHEALNMYNRAISLDASNPVFYCNRAAAQSRLGDYQKAVDDSKMSLRYDPNYSKAFGRLGLAYSKLNKHEEALDAYKNALRIEPDNVDYQNNMSVTQQRLDQQRTTGAGAAAGGIPGAAGFGGLDFAAALNNPALINMATRMMSEPSIQNLFSQLSTSGDMSSFYEIGQQLATQINTENPDLLSNIRSQMDGPAPPGGDNESDRNNQPPQPPQ